MSFNDIYQEYYSRAFRFVKSYVLDTAETEDIVSESMLQFWRTYDEKRGGSPLAYLYVILRSRSLDFLKSKRRHPSSDNVSDWHDGDLELRIKSLDSTPENVIFSGEINEIVNRTLAQMPTRTADIFRLARFENKTYKEIAIMYNISEKGVEYHMSQAFHLMRTALKDYLPVLVFLSILD